ncbi:MAG: cytidylate kinase family protein [Desulfobacterales bacterium]
MSIIIISSEDVREGDLVAQKIADAAGHKLLNRSILKEVAEKHHLSDTKIIAALDKPVTTFSMPMKVRKQCLAYIREAVLGELVKDNVVCHGLAAHLYVLGISHVLRARVLSDSGQRAGRLAAAESISVEKAVKKLNRQKKQRSQWSSELFRIDETDPGSYDLMINLSKIGTDEAVEIIIQMVASRRFTPMTYSIKCLQDLELAARIRSNLVERFPNIRVRADGGNVIVETLGLKREKRKKEAVIKEKVLKIPGVDYLEIHFINDFFRQAAESFR